MFRIGVIGAGHIGLVTAVCLAEMGNAVICVDNDRTKIAALKRGESPIYEPGLANLLLKNSAAKRIAFGHSIKEATQFSDIIFICVGTPTSAEGGADLWAVARVSTEIAKAMNGYKVIVGKSTVPAGTGLRIKQTIETMARRRLAFDVVSNPEFLREGQAIEDTLRPDRIVLGVESRRAERVMRKLYKPINAPILVTDIKTAEIIKHACNSFLATKISFINAIANVCERIGADVQAVADGMGLDKRIGRHFLNAGAGFGGYCFPKDLDVFIHLADRAGYSFELLKAVKKINADQKKLLIRKIEESLWIIKGKTIAVLGLSYKPNTDDIRNSIALDVIRMLQHEGAIIKAYDPRAMEEAQKELSGVTFCKDPYDAAKRADCLLLMTEWPVFKSMDLEKIKGLMRQPVIVDGRNVFSPGTMKKKGFVYRCVGRPFESDNQKSARTRNEGP